MSMIVNILTFVGTVLFWFVKKFFPFLIKKFGLLSVKMAIQKTVSAFLIVVIVAFFGFFVIFLSNVYTEFRNLILLLNNPSSFISGSALEYFNCFLNLLHTSGIASGFTSAFSFGMSVFIFFFLRGLYSTTIKVVRSISDEVHKNLSLL